MSDLTTSARQQPEYFSAKDFRLAKEGEGKYIAINQKTKELYYTSNRGERAKISKVFGLINKAIKTGEVGASNLSLLDDRFCALLEKARGEQKGFFKGLKKASLTVTEKLFLRTIQKESSKSMAQEALYNLNHRDPEQGSGFGTSRDGRTVHVNYSDMTIEVEEKDGEVTAWITKNGKKSAVAGEEALQIYEACKNRSRFSAQEIADTIKAQIRADPSEFLNNKNKMSFHDPATETTINFKFNKGVIICEAYKKVNGVKKKIALDSFATREFRDLVYPDSALIDAKVNKAFQDRSRLISSMTPSVMKTLGFSGAPMPSEQPQIYTDDGRRWQMAKNAFSEDVLVQIDSKGEAVNEFFQPDPYKLR
jgi:hypothetical protein